MDIREESIASSLIKEIESAQFADRRRDEYKSYKVSEGGQLPYIQEELETLFPKSWKTMRISDISLSNKIITKVSKAYKESPVRELGNETDNINEIFDDADFDSTMCEFDRDFNRQRYGLLWVNMIGEETAFHSLKGFESFVKLNPNTGKPEVVVVNYPDTDITSNANSTGDGEEQHLQDSQDDTSAESRKYAMWTNDHHAVWKVTEKKEISGQVKSAVENVEIEGNAEMRNSLGTIPFVYRSKNSSVDLPFLNQITEQSITFNILNSDLLTASALQGYGQLVISLPEDQATDTMHSGMTTAITIPIVNGADAQADAKYINANPDLAGMMDTINNYAGDVISEHLGVSETAKGDAKFSSGLERLIANATVTDKVTENQGIYAKMEKEVVDILRAYEVLRTEGDELVTIFPKAKVMISDKETLDNIKVRMDLGLMTKSDALMFIDPNMSKEAADKKLKEISSEKKSNLDEIMGGGNGDRTGQDQLQIRPQREIEGNTEGES